MSAIRRLEKTSFEQGLEGLFFRGGGRDFPRKGLFSLMGKGLLMKNVRRVRGGKESWEER